MVEILLDCPFCGCEHSVVVEARDWNAYLDGALAQDVFPYLNATEREQIISNICPSCQEDIFGEDE